MGGSKRLLEAQEELRSAAVQFLLSLGYLGECEVHGMVFARVDSLQGEWGRMMTERNKGAAGLAPWAADLETREFTDAVDQAFKDHWATGCTYPDCGDD